VRAGGTAARQDVVARVVPVSAWAVGAAAGSSRRDSP